jgi:amino acid transporter
MVLGAGARRLVPELKAAADPTRLLFQLSDRYAGLGLTLALSGLFVTSVFAGLLAFHNAAARYFFALGRDGLLPRSLGRVHPRHASPHIGSLVQTGLAAMTVAAFAAAGADPVLTLFNWLTNLGTVGVLALMALASFAAPAFLRRSAPEASPWIRIVAPLVAGAALAGACALAVADFGVLTGASKELAMLLPAALAAAALVGAGLGLKRGAQTQ